MMTGGHRALLRRAAELAGCVSGRGWPGTAADAIELAVPGEDLAGEEVAGPLDELLRACAEEADLSMVGRLSLRWDTLRLLRNLARMRAEEARTSAILEEEIAAPLVITGLPRSGSTFFHRLLGADPAMVAPLCWQTMYPYPDPRERRDQRAVRVERQLRQFAWFAPELNSVHPLDSFAPQECTEITSQVFQSLRFETVYRVPRYKAWLQAHGHAAAYRFHKRFLQHLRHQGQRGRWVLKCPDHVFALDALRAVYPDARVVFLHRDPLRVLPSVARLTEILRAPFTRRLDRREIGRMVVEDWVRGAALMLREARAPSFPPEQVLHLRYRDLAQRPLETVARLYRHFDLPLEPAALAAMQTLVAARPRGGYGENRYSFAAHGIDPDELRARFADYVGLFGVPAECEPPAPSRGERSQPAHASS
jgi:Sulfotransferase family